MGASNFLSAILFFTLVKGSWSNFSDIPGDYCLTRRDSSSGECCPDREDECSVPILGTLCYCDQFCDQHKNPDCCPDYRRVCLGEEPANITINRCFFNGNFYDPNERLKINCNDCTCVDLVDHMEIQCSRETCIIDEELIKNVNRDFRSRRKSWQASNYTEFWGRTLQDGLRYKLGTLNSRRKVRSMKALKIQPKRNLPRSFDSSTKWPGYILDPQDQGWCGASWVYSTVGVASDRWAIMSRGQVINGLSFQHLLACNSKNQKGCDGGHLTRAWAFIKKFGLVSGPCYKYTGSSTRCKIPKHRNATLARCEETSYKQPLYRVTPAYRISGEASIRQEIHNNGPVQATMRVPKDFFLYSSGVYTCDNVRRETSGLHSVRIVGWGEENINGDYVPYWIAANSWGTWWGETGLFRIRRGQNDCDIEEFVLGVWANTAKVPRDFNQLSNYIS